MGVKNHPIVVIGHGVRVAVLLVVLRLKGWMEMRDEGEEGGREGRR